MTDQPTDDTDVWSRPTIYFVGPGAQFSNVVLRTVETELNGPTRRVPDLNALRFAFSVETASRAAPRMVLVHISQVKDLLHDLRMAADYLPRGPLAVAFEEDQAARALFGRECDDLLRWQLSLLPMNTNITNWIRLLQLIESGGHYVPPEVMGGRARPAASAEPPVSQIGSGAGFASPNGATNAQDALTPREAEVLSMAAAGSPNKMIANQLQLSEHTVKLYMHRIIGKLGVKNRTEAAIWYHRNDQHG